MSKVERHETDPSPATLTAFDWLDTVVDEMLVAADKTPDRRSAAETLSSLPVLFESHILRRVVLGYSPMISRDLAVIATRLTVVPMRAGAKLDAGALLRTLGEVWPAGGGAVSLNVSSETLLSDLLRAKPTTNLLIEVPAFLAAEQCNVDALVELSSRGNTLLIKGRPLRELPRQVLPCFRWSIIDLADDRRVGKRPPSSVRRSIPHVQSGVRTTVQLIECFERGAIAVLGWPIDDPIQAPSAPRPAGCGRDDQPHRPSRAGRSTRTHVDARPGAGVRTDATHEFAGLRPGRRNRFVPSRHHDARLPRAQAMACAATRHDRRRQPPAACELCSDPPRTADEGTRHRHRQER